MLSGVHDGLLDHHLSLKRLMPLLFHVIASQSGPIVKALKAAKIPCKVHGAKKFWDLQEIKEMICMLRVTASPSGDVSALEVVLDTKAAPDIGRAPTAFQCYNIHPAYPGNV